MSGLLATLPVHLACQLITPRNLSLENLSPPTGTPSLKGAGVLPNGYTSFPDVGVAMKYYDNDLTWNLARKHCITEGGNLAVIDSFEKGRYANALRKTNPRGPFLGIHRFYDNVEWVGVKTGLPPLFIPWRSGMNQTTETRMCTALYGDHGGRVGPWECGKSWSYVCEIPILQEYRCVVEPSRNQTEKLAHDETVQKTDSDELVLN